MNRTKFKVTVSWIGHGMYEGSLFSYFTNFVDEKKARDYYTDMLVKYPDAEVTFEKV